MYKKVAVVVGMGVLQMPYCTTIKRIFITLTNESIRNYCVNLQCRREMLMMPFSEDGVVDKPDFLHVL